MPQTDPAPKTIPAPRCCVAHAWLPREVYEILQLAAARRRMHVDQLVARVLEVHAADLARNQEDRCQR